MNDSTTIGWICGWLFLGASYCFYFLGPKTTCCSRFFGLGDEAAPGTNLIGEPPSNPLQVNSQIPTVWSKCCINSELQNYSMELTEKRFDTLSLVFGRKPTAEVVPDMLLSSSITLSSSSESFSLPDEENDHCATSISSEMLLLPNPGVEVQTIDAKLNSAIDLSEEKERLYQGISLKSSVFRPVQNLCAVCLDSYSISDVVTWSSNPLCSHVFHRDCIVNWLAAQNRRSRANASMQQEELDNSIHLTCPCCRVPFINKKCAAEIPTNAGVNLDGEYNATAGANEEVENGQVENEIVVLTVLGEQ